MRRTACLILLVLVPAVGAAMVGSRSSAATGGAAPAQPASLLTQQAAAPLNPIQIENQNPGTPGWDDFASIAQQDAISGYGSKISVNHGDSIDFYVTTTAPSFTIDVFRTGWYQGIGARLMASLGSFPGVHQAIPPPDPVTGMVSAANWTKTTTLQIPASWVTGVYLAKLTASNGNASFIFFVVRDDGGTEPIEFQTSVTTYQAYNGWGGTSLYANTTNGSIYSGPHATKVTFDRPFDPLDSNGAGHYFYYEYPFIRWAESQGYNMTYTTDVDTDMNTNPLTNHKVFLSVGHDEYWSRPMRTNVENAINSGINVGFFGADEDYWQIRFEPNAAGAPDRVEVGYKDFATASTPPGPDPMYGVNNSIVTTLWRDDPVNQPENAMSGLMYEAQVDQSYPYVVQNSSNWVYAGSGFTDGSQVPGIVGYEYDKAFNNGAQPPGLTLLSNSPVVGCCGGSSSVSNSSIYTAPSGAQVFDAGTIQWSWGLDDFDAAGFRNSGIQQTTANILNAFSAGQATPVPGITATPATLAFGTQAPGTTTAAQTVTVTSTGQADAAISGISVIGTNAADFAQTNNCPATLTSGATCTVSITFTPSASGAESATLQIADNAADSPQGVLLSGAGSGGPAAVTIAPTSLNFGNQTVGGTSPSESLTVSSSGGSPLTISGISVTGTNAADFTQTSNCPLAPSTLAVSASCTVNVTFAPSATGPRAAAVQFVDSDASSPQSIPLAGSGSVASSGNPIVTENQQPGTTSWQLDNYNKAQSHEIEGYASLTSVNKGGSIDFKVNLSSNAQYTMDFYRLGWYPTGTNPDGTSCAPSCGGRLMLHVGPLNGGPQPNCPTITNTSSQQFGMTECNWATGYTLTVPTSWTTGDYLVKLRRLDGTNLENYMTFVVRDDSSTAPLVYSMDVNTWQAYNFWGGSGNGGVGYNLYGKFNDTSLASLSDNRAYTVSFDRPYLDQASIDGAGDVMVWDFPMIRFLESKGYNLTYITDVDLQSNPSVLAGRALFLNTGHDEYYSDTMRSAITNAIAGKVNMAFFSANNIYSRIIYGADGAGSPNRRVFDDKGALPNSTTAEYRYLTPPQPENAILGVMQNGVATAEPWLVNDPSSWIFAGTGLVKYTGNGTTGIVTSGPGQNALPALVGYEFDTRAVNGPLLSAFVSSEPPGVDEVAHSFVPAADNGVTAWSDATLYTAPSGAIIFSAGTIQWSFGVDDGYNDGFCNCSHTSTNAATQRITTNILDHAIASQTPQPGVTLTPGALAFGSQRVGTTSAPQQATLTNSGTLALQISGISVTGTNAADFAITANTCPASLAAGANCTITSTFTPSVTGAESAAIAIADNALGSPQTITLTGTGVVPAASLSPSNLTFPSTQIGLTSATQIVTIANSGGAPMTITGVSLAGANPGDFTETTNCPAAPATLAPAASCNATIAFAPTTTGSRSAALQVTDDAAGSPQSATLTGTGIAPAPAVGLSPTSLTFLSQLIGTTSPAQTVTLTNTGLAALTISSIAVGGTNAGDFGSATTCPMSPASLAPGANCTISVAFAPTAAGARSATVAITDNAADSPESIGLSGTGATPVPGAGLAPTSLTFASQAVGTTSPAQTVTLTSSGTGPLTITAIAPGGTNAGDFATTTTCPLSPATLTAGANCTVSVTFKPTATGTRRGTVAVTDNASGSPQSVTLTGTATAAPPTATLTPASLAFANQTVATSSASQALTLKNTSTTSLRISSVALGGTNAGDFSRTNGCSSTLAAGASCSITVTFRPTAGGPRSATLNVTDNATGSPQSSALTGTGYYLLEGFESGSLTGWTQAGAGTSAVETTVVHSGTYALALTTNASNARTAYHNLGGGAEATAYTRLYFQYGSLTGTVPIAYGTNSTATKRWELDFVSSTKSLTLSAWSNAGIQTTVAATGSLSPNTWYSLEVDLRASTTGGADLWINGTQAASLSGDYSTTTPYARLYLSNNKGSGTDYFDDIVVSPSQVGP
jgi:hypothetical protein